MPDLNRIMRSRFEVATTALLFWRFPYAQEERGNKNIPDICFLIIHYTTLHDYIHLHQYPTQPYRILLFTLYQNYNTLSTTYTYPSLHSHTYCSVTHCTTLHYTILINYTA